MFPIVILNALAGFHEVQFTNHWRNSAVPVLDWRVLYTPSLLTKFNALVKAYFHENRKFITKFTRQKWTLSSATSIQSKPVPAPHTHIYRFPRSNLIISSHLKSFIFPWDFQITISCIFTLINSCYTHRKHPTITLLMLCTPPHHVLSPVYYWFWLLYCPQALSDCTYPLQWTTKLHAYVKPRINYILTSLSLRQRSKHSKLACSKHCPNLICC